MLLTYRTTLTQFLIEERRRFPHMDNINGVILNAALTCKSIARAVAFGAIEQLHGDAGSTNAHGEAQKKLDVQSNDAFLHVNEWGGHLAGMMSEEMDAPYQIPDTYPKGKHLLVFDPLDGSSNIDVNVSVGSIFSVLRAPDRGGLVTEQDFLKPGIEQVAAGYAIYGPSTMFVLTVGNGVNGFTLDPSLGEFVLTHPNLRIPADTREFAINASNNRFWESPIKRYVDECLAGKSGPRGKDFNMRWVASLVAEAHRILMRGGVFMYPRDMKDPNIPGKLRLLYEANPIGLLIEQAGGRASTGRQPVLAVQPSSLHQRIGLVFGSKNEVERIERYHQQNMLDEELPSPLFAERGLFRAPI